MNGRVRWWVLFLIFIATCINYLDRQIIGLLKPLLEKEFNWTETDYAHIVMAFSAAYAIGLLISGNIIDRIGTKLGYTLSIASWSVMGMLHALAKTVIGFSLARTGLGFSESGNYPAGMKTIAEWFPKQERGFAAGIFNAGTSIGVVFALIIVPLILRYGAWKDVFWITGSIGFIWLIFWIWYYKPIHSSRSISKEELDYIVQGQEVNDSGEESVRWYTLLKYPQTWTLICGKFFIDPIFWFYLFWLPSYFFTRFGLDLKKPSLELIIIYVVTSVGSFAGGYFSSLLVKRGMSTIEARKRVICTVAVLELSVLLIPYTQTSLQAMFLLGFTVAIHQAWSTNMFTLGSDFFPKKAVATSIGIAGMMGAVGGILFPIITGKLLDHYKSIDALEHGYNVLFTGCGLTYLIVYGMMHYLSKNRGMVNL